MPKSLPKEALELWERVFDKAKEAGDDEETAAKKAWGALKKSGWSKDEDGRWNKKDQLSELSLTIKKASFDAETGERRWRAETSDTSNDLHDDNMTLELFSDFVARIEAGQEAPHNSRSAYWKGGMPYISVSHYPDFNGEAVPGEVKAVYVDGNYLKAKGTFNDTVLGKACWKAICDDLENKDLNPEDKIRISIGFLDYGHIHKDSGYVFERKSLKDQCPECFMSMFTGENGAKSFKKGQLVHLALTRVPANTNTDINPDLEVERSMATRKEDAASIIGEKLAEEIEGLSDKLPDDIEKALVVKADEVEAEDEPEEKEVEPEVELVEEAVTNTKTEPEPVEAHVLDEAYAQLKADYDSVELAEVSSEEKLRAVQPAFEAFGNYLASTLKDNEPEVVEDASVDIAKMIAEAMEPILARLDLLTAQKAEYNPPKQPVAQRRSMTAQEVVPALNLAGQKPRMKSISEIVNESVGLPTNYDRQM